MSGINYVAMSESNSGLTDPKSLQSTSTYGTLGNIVEDDEDCTQYHCLVKHDSGIMGSSADTLFNERDSERRYSLEQSTPIVKIQGVFSWDGEEKSLVIQQSLDITRGIVDKYFEKCQKIACFLYIVKEKLMSAELYVKIS